MSVPTARRRRRGARARRLTAHLPPATVTGSCGLRDGEPAAFSAHLADLEGDRLRSIVVFAERHGLELRIDPASWAGPRTVCVVFFAPEWAPRDDE